MSFQGKYAGDVDSRAHVPSDFRIRHSVTEVTEGGFSVRMRIVCVDVSKSVSKETSWEG